MENLINELYKFRALYNALAFNNLKGIDCYKAKKHHDGEMPYEGYFIVIANLPNGQISNHYPIMFWDLFQIPEYEIAKDEYDGHTPLDVINRLTKFLTESCD